MNGYPRCSVSAVEYYVAIKRSEVLVQATAWRNSESMILSAKERNTRVSMFCDSKLNIQNRQIKKQKVDS